ncbi:apolipoprotein N-acyltransferase [Tropicimonas isoalkanivorans]|uniref:Apolipoprotein N-acyltransferase n=1 Tax=Tropicimonas isoalkanivorans TaxID=441112 RepID=A0A1I1IPB1_9RHOB|nr:apolipoprotein N-acyltransferase [Tropicimonas isoalkanivorans]SFC36118.1 apolipoprotein N-acyltransferase [Tropicimonas isoalkanivorans]
MSAAIMRAVETRRSGQLLCICLGALLAMGQAPLGWAWGAVAVLAVALYLISVPADWRVAAWRGWALGTGYFAAALFWIVEPFLVDIGRHGWMAPFALVFMAGGLALFWALAFGLAGRFGSTRRQRAALAIVTLTGAEMLRSVIFTGFPWALVGHIWIGWPQMQLAAIVGAHGLTVLTVSAAALPAIFGPARVWLGVLAGVALLGLSGLFGTFRVPDDPALLVSDPPSIVRLVQPNAPQHLKWSPEMAPIYYQRLLEQTAAAPSTGGPRPGLVIWPETSVPALLHNAAPAFEAIADAAQGAQSIVGLQRIDDQGRWFNSLVALSSEGGIEALYDKHHLVPFGEYMPLVEIFARWGVFGLAANETGGYSSGPGPQVLDLDGFGRMLPLICYEAIFPGDISGAPVRADWIVQITNDAWFGHLSGPFQHLAQARLRAVEQGLPLFRAANTGVSAAFDPYGRELARVPLDTAGFIDAPLPAPLPPTVYARYGDTPVGILLLALGAVIVLSRRRARLG